MGVLTIAMVLILLGVPLAVGGGYLSKYGKQDKDAAEQKTATTLLALGIVVAIIGLLAPLTMLI
jgi:uncharacterized membrane protein